MILSYFFIVYVLTIVVTRVFLKFWSIHAHKIGNFQPHHYMHGLILVAVYFLIPQPIILAVGSALIVDEIPLFFIFKTWNWPDNHWKEYHSMQCVGGIIIISLLGYLALRFLIF